MHLSTSQTLVIGDTMETDILGGVQMGCHTILVLSGGTSREDIERFAYRPDLVVESVAELAAFSHLIDPLLASARPEDDTVDDLDAWKALQA